MKCLSFNTLEGGNEYYNQLSSALQLKYQQSMTDARWKKPLRFPFIDWDVSGFFILLSPKLNLHEVYNQETE